jgi:hypothetical protein
MVEAFKSQAWIFCHPRRGIRATNPWFLSNNHGKVSSKHEEHVDLAARNVAGKT